MNIKQKIGVSAQEYRDVLKPALLLIDTTEKENTVFSKFFFVFQLYMIPWLIKCMKACATPQAKKAMLKEFNLEMTGNKQGLLLDFFHKLNVILNGSHAYELEGCITNITNVMSKGERINNGMGASIVIFFFKEFSKEYLLWMQKVAEARGIRNHQYVKILDKKDEAYPQQKAQLQHIVEGIIEESALLSKPDALALADEAKAAVALLFTKIFIK